MKKRLNFYSPVHYCCYRLSVTYKHSVSANKKLTNISNTFSGKIPLKDKVGIPGLFQLDYHLYNLATEIGQTDEKKVAVSGIIDGILQAKSKNMMPRLSEYGYYPFYDPEKAHYIKRYPFTKLFRNT
ncbi:Protein of uncharacterised function (DUF1439) [Actinobacillus equuli]|nr:Protein of uncharacterised function (DUF1439) [Actinobacillus equuli]